MLSLIIPCYNEEDNVVRMFDEVERVFSGKVQDYELVFVDDGSKDATYQNLKKLYAEHAGGRIQVLSFSRNFGKESAIYAGLRHAKGNKVCLIDADLQQRPEVVLQMLEIMEADEEIDCVTAYQANRKEGKVLAGWKSAFYAIINKMTDVDFVNGASDFRLMKRSMVDAVLSMTECHRFSKGIFSWVGFKTAYIPYEAAERTSGVSKWNFKKLWKYAWEGIMAFTTAPLRIPTFLGVGSLIASAIYLLVLLIRKWMLHIHIGGESALLCLILFMSGCILCSLGILGAYLSKMYVQEKHRPIYIVRRHLHDDENTIS